MCETNATAPGTDRAAGCIAPWHTSGCRRHREAIATTGAPEARSLDLLSNAEGYAAPGALVAAAHGRLPNRPFRLPGSVSAHHDRARRGWKPAGSTVSSPVAAGVDRVARVR